MRSVNGRGDGILSKLIDAEKLDFVSYQGIPDGYKDSFDSGILYAMNLIDDQPTIDAVPVSTLEQIKWERDSFAEQIREIGGEPFAKWDAMDVVKVVRCKDCKYADKNGEQCFCKISDYLHWHESDFFCAYGEKVTE